MGEESFGWMKLQERDEINKKLTNFRNNNFRLEFNLCGKGWIRKPVFPHQTYVNIRIYPEISNFFDQKAW